MSRAFKKQLFIGTSGWFYQHWQDSVYPQKLKPADWLTYYATHFKTVEANNTFYRMPSQTMVQGWYEKTPADFKFALKISRFISHIKQLKFIEEPWKKFLKIKLILKQKAGPFLLQLPPSFTYSRDNFNRLAHFLKISQGTQLAIEFRHKSWNRKYVFDILKSNKKAICIADGPKNTIPYFEEVTANFVYLRFHGRESLYVSNYSEKELEKWAKKIKKWLKDGLSVFAYFNNDAKGFAFKNAKKLLQLI